MDPLEIPLRDIHLPEPVSWWPLAPAWWIAGALFLLLVAAAWFAWKRHLKRRVQRAAVREFNAIEARYRASGDVHGLARELSNLARRVAIALSPHAQANTLTGDAWLEFLSSLSATDAQLSALKDALTVAPYRRAETLDGNELLETFRPWLDELRPLERSSQ